MPFKHIEILLTIIYLVLFCSCALPPVEYQYTEIFPEGWRSISIVAMNNNKEVKPLDTKRFAERLNGFSAGKNILTQETITNLQSLSVPAKSATIIELVK